MNSDAEYKSKLKSVSKALAVIHKSLLENEIESLERDQGQTLNPGTRLQLLINDPDFAWLRLLSQLISSVDGAIFQKTPVTQEQLDLLIKQTTDLLIDHKNAEFSKHFIPICRTFPDLIVEYGRLKMALKS